MSKRQSESGTAPADATTPGGPLPKKAKTDSAESRFKKSALAWTARKGTVGARKSDHGTLAEQDILRSIRRFLAKTGAPPRFAFQDSKYPDAPAPQWIETPCTLEELFASADYEPGNLHDIDYEGMLRNDKVHCFLEDAGIDVTEAGLEDWVRNARHLPGKGGVPAWIVPVFVRNTRKPFTEVGTLEFGDFASPEDSPGYGGDLGHSYPTLLSVIRGVMGDDLDPARWSISSSLNVKGGCHIWGRTWREEGEVEEDA